MTLFLSKLLESLCMASCLERLSVEQARLVSNNQLIKQQVGRQEELTKEMIEFSQTLICDLRWLSLIRKRIIQNDTRDLKRLLKSQTFQGLKFAQFQYCPAFIDANKLNHYMYLASFFRKNTNALAEVFMSYSKAHPEKMYRLAFSTFLCLFQQGWCSEEDSMIAKCLKEMANIQFREAKERSFEEVRPTLPRKLLYPLACPECSLYAMQPFITFTTAYLFNGASLTYLQSALAPIIIKLHSMSHLRDLRNTFQAETDTGKVGTVEYWKQVSDYAYEVYCSLLSCLELLPPGVFELFAHLQTIKADARLVFFESFINRALDNPAILGFLPWHPAHGGWRPSKDIADVFRTKYVDSLMSRSVVILGKLLENFESYRNIDMDNFMIQLAKRSRMKSNSMISETELLSTNPSFPKELLVTGSDLCLLHEATLGTEINYPELKNIVERMGPVLEKNDYAGEHFRVVIIRRQETTAAAKRLKRVSLFVKSKDVEKELEAQKQPVKQDPFAERLCDTIAALPPFGILAQGLGATELSEFFHKLHMISPLFMNADSAIFAASTFWYSCIGERDEEQLIRAVTTAADERDARALAMADKCASLRTQHQNISDALATLRGIKNNVHSHMLLQVAESFIDNEMSQFFREAMLHEHEYLTNLTVFKSAAMSMVKEARSKLATYTIQPAFRSVVVRIMFFRLAENITFGRFLLVKRSNWKRSIIISTILEKHGHEIMSKITSKAPAVWEDKIRYVRRAADLLGHIRTSSGFSVIVHTVLEAVSILQTLCANCKAVTMDDCLALMFLGQVKHPFLISKFLQHLLLDPLSNGTLEFMFSSDEIGRLAMFPSAMLLLLEICRDYDSRIEPEWTRLDKE